MPVPTAVAPSGTSSSGSSDLPSSAAARRDGRRLRPVVGGDRQRHRILQARAPEPEVVAGLLRKPLQRIDHGAETGERIGRAGLHRESERRRHDVVRRLRAVDVVERVHDVVAARLASQEHR
jgi:hypothetical protein